MTAFTWTAADGSTGRLTSRAAGAVAERHGENAPPVTIPGGPADNELYYGWVMGARDFARAAGDHHAASDLTALLFAMADGPVTLERDQ